MVVWSECKTYACCHLPSNILVSPLAPAIHYPAAKNGLPKLLSQTMLHSLAQDTPVTPLHTGNSTQASYHGL